MEKRICISVDNVLKGPSLGSWSSVAQLVCVSVTFGFVDDDSSHSPARHRLDHSSRTFRFVHYMPGK